LVHGRLETTNGGKSAAKAAAQNPAGEESQRDDGNDDEKTRGGPGGIRALGLLSFLRLDYRVKETIVLAVHVNEYETISAEYKACE
jgi:hypothetical protein